MSVCLPVLKCDVVDQESHTYGENVSLPLFTLKPPNDGMLFSSEVFTWLYTILGKFYYGIRIVTGSHIERVIRSFSITISLSGSKATTGKINLQKNINFWDDSDDNHNCSTYDDYVIACDTDLGYVRVASIEINYTYLPDDCVIKWRIDYIDVFHFQDGCNIVHFPCYKWIEKEIVCTPARSKSKIVKN